MHNPKSILLILAITNALINAQIVNTNINIQPLNNTSTTREKNITLNNIEETITVHFESLINVNFFVIQVHSFKNNLTLSNTSTYEPKTFVHGTNIGLVQKIHGIDTYKFFVRIFGGVNTTILAIITTYANKVPIPGGCSMTFNTKIAPYQIISYTNDLIKVDLQAPSIKGHFCEDDVVKLDMYHMYLTGWDLSETTYFAGISKMSTVESVKIHGTLVTVPIGKTNLRRYYNNYAGIGSIFVAIATFANHSSVYVPTVSYGCDISNGKQSCDTSIYWAVMAPIFIIFGIIINGGVDAMMALFVANLIAIEFMHILIYLIYGEDAIFTTISLGIQFAFLITYVLFKFDLHSILFDIIYGYLVASIIFFSMGDLEIFQNDWNFWGVFSSIFILFSVFRRLGGEHLIQLTSMILVIIGANYYMGGVLYYAILNTMRRTTVGYFNLAVIDAPIQKPDVICLLVGFAMYLIGIACPCTRRTPRNDATVSVNEESPLLG